MQLTMTLEQFQTLGAQLKESDAELNTTSGFTGTLTTEDAELGFSYDGTATKEHNMWTYHIPTGNINRPDGSLLTVAYSGHGAGLNNPAMCGVPDVGPIPPGPYTLSPFFTHPRLGVLVARFMPKPGNTECGRSGCDLHGDNKYMDYTASDGCVVADHDARLEISQSTDTDWMVLPN